MGSMSPIMLKTQRPLSKMGLLLAFCGVAMVGIACWLVWVTLQLLFWWCVTQFWIPTEAGVLTAELVEFHNKRGDHYLAKASFQYQWNGQQHIGHRVWLSEFRDSEGGVQQYLGEQLIELAKSGQRTVCFVNPHHPADAILFRQIYSETLTLLSLLTIACGGLGAVLLAITIRREPNMDEIKTAFPKQPWRWLAEWHNEEINPRVPDRISLPAIAFCLLTMPANIAALAEVLIDQSFSGWHVVNAGFIVLTAIFVRSWVRHWRFGKIGLLLHDREGRSDELRGKLIIEKGVPGKTPIKLRLECRLSQRFTKKGGSESEGVIPHVDRLSSSTELDHSGQIQVPFRFALPSGLPNSSHDAFQGESISKRQRTEWTLYAGTRETFPAFRSQFFVPVFRRKPTAEKSQDDLIHFYTVLKDPVELLTSEGLIITALTEGTMQIHIPRTFQWKQKVFLAIYASGILIGAFFLKELSLPMAIIMMIGGICLLLTALIRTLQSERIEFKSDSIRVQRSMAPFFNQTTEVDYKDIRHVPAFDRPAKQWFRPQSFLSGLVPDPQVILVTKSDSEVSICHQTSLQAAITIQAMILKHTSQPQNAPNS